MIFLTATATPVPTATPDAATGVEIIQQVTEAAKKGSIVKDLQDYFHESIVPAMTSIAINILIALVIYLIGRRVIHWILKLLKHSFERSKLDEAASDFLLTASKVVLNAIMLIILAGIVGFEMSSIAALLASASLAIGLALQGSLSNFAGGVLILMLKPFTLGDYIIAGDNEGIVNKIDIFSTRLVTVDNKLIILPNGTLSNMNITNVTNQVTRRLDLIIPVAYESDIDHVKELLHDIAITSEMVLKDQEMQIFLSSFGDSAINMGYRVWVKTEDYWSTKFETQERIKKVFDKENISIPFNQLDVKITHTNRES